MIKSIKDKRTEMLWFGEYNRKLDIKLQELARMKLRMMNSAQDLNDLKIPPSNHLKKLHGDRQGFFSIRVNKRWRLVFEFDGKNCHKVEFVDYH